MELKCYFNTKMSDAETLSVGIKELNISTQSNHEELAGVIADGLPTKTNEPSDDVLGYV